MSPCQWKGMNSGGKEPKIGEVLASFVNVTGNQPISVYLLLLTFPGPARAKARGMSMVRTMDLTVGFPSIVFGVRQFLGLMRLIKSRKVGKSRASLVSTSTGR